jgi:hydrogenase 3 maturation protease
VIAVKAVVGLGNPLKGDDNIGNIVLDRFGHLDGVKTFKGIPENLTAPLRELSPSKVFFIDAVDFGGRPGEVRLYRLADTETPIPSTHSFPVQILQSFLPKTEFFVIGIQPARVNYSTKLSPELAPQVKQIVADVKAVISQ